MVSAMHSTIVSNCHRNNKNVSCYPNLGEVGGLTDYIHATESDDLRLTFVPCTHDDISQYVNSFLGTVALHLPFTRLGIPGVELIWRNYDDLPHSTIKILKIRHFNHSY